MDELKVISRADAKALGLKHYYTGKPCKNGHVDKRYVHIGVCAECLRITAAKTAALFKESRLERDRLRESFTMHGIERLKGR